MSEFVDPSRAIHHSPLRRLSPMYARLVPLSRCVDVFEALYSGLERSAVYYQVCIAMNKKDF